MYEAGKQTLGSKYTKYYLVLVEVNGVKHDSNTQLACLDIFSFVMS